MRRRTLIAPLALVVLVAGGHTLLWRAAEGRLKDGFRAWGAEEKAQGWTITAAKPEIGGWPLAAKLTVPDMFVSGGADDIPGGLTWSADRVVLTVSLLAPHALTVEFQGAQQLRLGSGPDIPYTADVMKMVVPIEPGVPPHSADLTANNLRAGMPAGAGSPKGSTAGLTVGLLQVHASMMPAAPQGEAAVSFALRSDDIGLPPDRDWALGQRIGSFSIEGALNGPLPRTPGLVARATGWRDGGGSLEISRLAMGWGPMGLSATATLALDDGLQPMGTGMARIVGYAPTLDRLGSHHVIRPGAALAAKAVLALLARTPDGGGEPEVDVPLTLQNQTLSVRQIPLARLPDITWPAQ